MASGRLSAVWTRQGLRSPSEETSTAVWAEHTHSPSRQSTLLYNMHRRYKYLIACTVGWTLAGKCKGLSRCLPKADQAS